MHRSVQILTERITTEKESDKGKEIKCSNCEYKCSLNIQLRRHQQLKHAEHIAKAAKLVTEEGNQGTKANCNLYFLVISVIMTQKTAKKLRIT